MYLVELLGLEAVLGVALFPAFQVPLLLHLLQPTVQPAPPRHHPLLNILTTATDHQSAQTSYNILTTASNSQAAPP